MACIQRPQITSPSRGRRVVHRSHAARLRTAAKEDIDDGCRIRRAVGMGCHAVLQKIQAALSRTPRSCPGVSNGLLISDRCCVSGVRERRTSPSPRPEPPPGDHPEGAASNAEGCLAAKKRKRYANPDELRALATRLSRSATRSRCALGPRRLGTRCGRLVSRPKSGAAQTFQNRHSEPNPD
jgi:hypothetical protein